MRESKPAACESECPFIADGAATARLLLPDRVNPERKLRAGPNWPRDGSGFVGGEANRGRAARSTIRMWAALEGVPGSAGRTESTSSADCWESWFDDLFRPDADHGLSKESL
jgi:hypothetical protein